MTDYIHEFKQRGDVPNYVFGHYCVRCFRRYYTIHEEINYKIKTKHKYRVPYEYSEEVDLLEIAKLLPCVTDKVYLKKQIKLRNLPIKYFKKKDLIKKMSSHFWSKPNPIFIGADHDKTLFEYICQKCQYKIRLNPLQSFKQDIEILSCAEMAIKDIIL